LNPISGEKLFNFWGYDSLGYFTPKASYAAENGQGNQVVEFKTMVKEFHKAGIEVILDIVFNHTGEGERGGPIFSFRGLDNAVYYMTDRSSGQYHNFTGCGNTVNCNHPAVQQMILDALGYWITEMHVDGFRFDLASILSRGEDGSVMDHPPILDKINKDPVLSQKKLIAEAWDAAGLYQVGSFPGGKRWAEWNDKFRDNIRRYIRGDKGQVGELATRIAGSSDLFQNNGRAPYHSINFITCHDGFTLNDLVSYDRKHNKMNGENNRDGMNENFSSNYGKEGPSNDIELNFLRKKQIKNMATLLLISQGVPMILAGDEFGRTQQGNNNPYCQDNEISWVNWELARQNAGLLRFFSHLIQFRKNHPALRRPVFFDDDRSGNIPIHWYKSQLNRPDWSGKTASLAFHLLPVPGDTDIFVISNSEKRKKRFLLPNLPFGKTWFLTLNTDLTEPEDINAQDHEKHLTDQRHYMVEAQSTVILISK
jgi:isoamylase